MKQNASSSRLAVGRRASVLGILANVFLFAVKFAAGLITGSLAITADAFNNLGDSASAIVSFLGFRLAERPADADHPYGHGRYEYLSSLAVSFLILLFGVELTKSSVSRILHPEKNVFSLFAVVFLVLSVCVKLVLAVFYRKTAKKIGSETLSASAADSRNDVFVTTAVLLSCLVEHCFSFNPDAYVSLAISLVILFSGSVLLKNAVSPLLGTRADATLIERLDSLIRSHDGVLGTHDLLIHDYGHGVCHASVHVELPASLDPLLCHDLIDKIECAAEKELSVSLVIHFDPVVEGDEEKNKMLSVVTALLQDIHPRLSLHDFRLVHGAVQDKLIFDLAVPYDLTDEREQFKTRLDEELRQRGHRYTTVIHFDASL